MERKGPDRDALAAGLADTLARLELGRAGPEALVPLADKGLAHDHLRVEGTGLLLRVPKQSQFAMTPAANLAYQAACFERVSRSRHAPRLHATIEPSERLPMGALVVDFIEGRPPSLPDDLPELARAMARVHALPVPPPADRPPLEDHRDPVAGAMKEIDNQAAYLDAAGLEPAARTEIEEELDWARSFAQRVAHDATPQPVRLVLTDTHPGNFLIAEEAEDGKETRAVIVDLEKALYGSPGIDLAHATVYSSTTWDVDTFAELSIDQVAAFYRTYLETVTDVAGQAFADELQPWLIPMRRILFLRAITWCAMWRVEHRRDAASEDPASGWAAEKSDPALIEHVRGRTDLYLSPEALERMRREWLDEDGLMARL